MINLDGATLLFPTSFGYYSPHMLKLASKYPTIRFEHCGGLWTDKDPKNAGSYFGYIDEAQHVSGIVAGHSTKSGKLGFVAAKPIPQVLRNINAFTLGAKLALRSTFTSTCIRARSAPGSPGRTHSRAQRR
jgi:simple sugar transport system substrate-binding protein